jgi:hypothetical protein
MPSPMRCSVPNRVCSEVLSFRVSLERQDQASLSSLARRDGDYAMSASGISASCPVSRASAITSAIVRSAPTSCHRNAARSLGAS